TLSLDILHHTDTLPLDILHHTDTLPLDILHHTDTLHLDILHHTDTLHLDILHHTDTLPLDILHHTDTLPLDILHHTDTLHLVPLHHTESQCTLCGEPEGPSPECRSVANLPGALRKPKSSSQKPSVIRSTSVKHWNLLSPSSIHVKMKSEPQIMTFDVQVDSVILDGSLNYTLQSFSNFHVIIFLFAYFTFCALFWLLLESESEREHKFGMFSNSSSSTYLAIDHCE
ncbi:hypothetical protein STEG23_020948, partial [Scotinomys teguina]